MKARSVVQFKDVSKDYPAGWLGRARLRAVDQVSFEALTGEVVGLLGPNRAGKTTLAKILLTLCRPTSGTVMRLGRPASDRRTLARVGYVHERPSFPRYLTATELLGYFGSLSLIPRETLRRRIPELLERVGLRDRSEEPIVRFSKGMVQRLALAQALINEPELLIFDEPHEGLDLAGRQLVGELIQAHRRGGGSTLLISHLVTDVEAYCDRVAVLVGGRLAHFGPPEGLSSARGGQTKHTLERRLLHLYEGSPA